MQLPRSHSGGENQRRHHQEAQSPVTEGSGSLVIEFPAGVTCQALDARPAVLLGPPFFKNNIISFGLHNFQAILWRYVIQCYFYFQRSVAMVKINF